MTCLNDTLTLARVNHLLAYCPLSGEFRWLEFRHGARSDLSAGGLDAKGYHRIKIDGRLHKAHRLAWLIHYGVWPPEQIDHINGIKGDNRISNLRLATNAENGQNRSRQKNNSSGYSGVYFDTRRQEWQARIRVDRKHTHLGYFDTREEAIVARQAAETLYFKEFRHAARSRQTN